MTKRVIVIAPESQPGSGGLADYTLRLLEQLPADDGIDIVVPEKNFFSIPANATKLLVQYSAYGFSRSGCPLAFIRNLIEWKKRSRGRLVLMFHEIWSFWPVTNWNFFLQLLHRRAIKGLLPHCDAIFTSTTSQAEHLRALCSHRPVRVLPVGSNIRPIGPGAIARKRRWAVLFGLQRTRLRSLEKIESNLKSLIDAKVITRFISIGGGSDPDCLNQERQILERLAPVEGFEQAGNQSEEIVSQKLAAASLGIFGQSELSYEKSGTFMAYAAHKLNIVADFADTAKPPPVCWLVSTRDLLDGITETELETRAQRLRHWQEQNSSWMIIARRVAEALELNNLAGMQIANR